MGIPWGDVNEELTVQNIYRVKVREIDLYPIYLFREYETFSVK